jgi:hypothetical protein
MKKLNIYLRLFVSFISAAIIGIALSALYPAANLFNAWFSTLLILWVGFFCLLTVWKWTGSTRQMGWMITIMFVLRLAIPISLSAVLPTLGYDNPHQNAGYLFKDSFYRDQAAWALAASDTPILAAFQEEFATDQYGGLLSLSAFVYRYLSPDAHRPHLILILAALAGALSVPFFWNALNRRWGSSLATFAVWILILYPEGIFYSASQMREPFLISGFAIATWGILNWKPSRNLSLIAITTSILFMALISWRITILLIGALFIWFWIENYAGSIRSQAKGSKWIIPIIIILSSIAILSSLTWLRTSMWWDFRMTEQNSERLVLEIERIGEQWRAPVIVAFGVTQVILPAAIVQPSIALWRGLTIFRSAGWYLMAPMLLYSLFIFWKAKTQKDRAVLFWLISATIGWTLLASARAGGDLWDNPRYRTIFLPWMAILASWAWQNRNAWLGRLFLIESIFLGFFTEWYIARYYLGNWIRMPFWEIVVWIGVLSVLVILIGLGWDYRYQLKPFGHIINNRSE